MCSLLFSLPCICYVIAKDVMRTVVCVLARFAHFQCCICVVYSLNRISLQKVFVCETKRELSVWQKHIKDEKPESTISRSRKQTCIMHINRARAACGGKKCWSSHKIELLNGWTKVWKSSDIDSFEWQQFLYGFRHAVRRVKNVFQFTIQIRSKTLVYIFHTKQR